MNFAQEIFCYVQGEHRPQASGDPALGDPETNNATHIIQCIFIL